ncbi:hypothetical protein [Amycolatopsis sp. FDAARGOS 1241]|uniref:hypothetical protein n=1 Tax=Amycolatopsis sp. FDAARGOS 1241 TaxID=2778070 RepID=UPI001951E285|nr:hypothetical protein [Amycolatopsis sp. FDAARGOS 1241]QRP48004.1 hypothetical protein I6J71_09005 [Amycolatopsis sp. FDAARGOS 1241]
MSLKVRRLKVITLTIGGVSVECQLSSWTLDPGVQDGDRLYTYCPDGTAIGETDAEPTLAVTAFSDWSAGGFEDFLWTNRGTVVEFELNHHPDITGEHVRWTGQLMAQPAPVGGDRGDNETTEITFQVIGDPVYSRP